MKFYMVGILFERKIHGRIDFDLIKIGFEQWRARFSSYDRNLHVKKEHKYGNDSFLAIEISKKNQRGWWFTYGVVAEAEVGGGQWLPWQ